MGAIPTITESTPEEFLDATHHLKIRMSFDECIKDYDEVVDGIPSQPSIAINEQVHNKFPRRVWDIRANTVIPAAWFCGLPCPLTYLPVVGALGVTRVSHAPVTDGDLTYIVTEANQEMWPIPLPRGVHIEDVRRGMIRLGVRYAWLDVLCLRQQAGPALAKDLTIPVNREVMERLEQRRLEEWKADVPAIGAIHLDLGENGFYSSSPIVNFMNGLGRPPPPGIFSAGKRTHGYCSIEPKTYLDSLFKLSIYMHYGIIISIFIWSPFVTLSCVLGLG